MTNLERLRTMTAKKFAKEMVWGFTCDFCPYKYKDNRCETEGSCTMGFIIWLNEEAREKKEDED